MSAQPGGNPEEQPPPAPAPTAAAPSSTDIGAVESDDIKQASTSPSASEVDRLVDDTDPNRDLAKVAYGYDPFKGSHLDSSRRAHHNTRSQNRPQPGTASASTSKSYPAMAVFPGQGSRGTTGQPVSAMRTSEGDVGADGTTDADHHLTDETAAATAIALAAARDGQANMYGSPFGHAASDDYERSQRGEGSADQQQQQQHQQHQHQHSMSPAAAGQSAVGHDSLPDSDTSMSQGHVGGVTKRKKTFKYLQDEPPVDPSVPRAPHEKRKKVQKACRPCKRSHMPCQDVRPCPRCVKRGIPELCVDAEPITRRPRKYGDQQQGSQTQTQQSSAQSSQQAADESMEDPSEIQKLAQAAEAQQRTANQNVSVELEKPVPTASELDPIYVQSIRASLRKGDEDLQDRYGDIPLRILADPVLWPEDEQEGAAPPPPPPANAFEPERPKDSADAAHVAHSNDALTKPFSYTQSYARLAKWVLAELDPNLGAEVEVAIGAQRAHLIGLSMPMTLDELRALEDATRAALSHARAHVLPYVPLPMLVLRRSGEIHAANTHATQAFTHVDLGTAAQEHSPRNVLDLVGAWNAAEVAGLLNTVTVVQIGKPVSRSVRIGLPRGSDPRRGMTVEDSEAQHLITMESRPWALDAGGEGGVSGADDAGQGEDEDEATVARRARAAAMPTMILCTLTPLWAV